MAQKYVSFLKCCASDGTNYFGLGSLMLNRVEILLPHLTLSPHNNVNLYLTEAETGNKQIK